MDVAGGHIPRRSIALPAETAFMFPFRSGLEPGYCILPLGNQEIVGLPDQDHRKYARGFTAS